MRGYWRPDDVKDYIYRRLWEILNGQGSGKDHPHLDAQDRRAIVGMILRETKPGLPDYWMVLTPPPAPG
jgi:hypothetical protein